MKQYVAIADTVYFWFGANDTSGSGGDGASPAADVRLAGAAADAAPVYSPTPVLLPHVNYPAGAYEIAITASVANGFATGNTYAVFCTLAIDSQNPTGFVGSFDTKPVESNITQIGDAAQSATDLKDLADTGYDPATHRMQSNLKAINTSSTSAVDLKNFVDDGYDPLTHKVQGVVLVDTVTALTGHTAQTGDSFARLGAPAGASIAADLVVIDNFVDDLETRLTAARAGYLDNLSAGAVALASGVDLTHVHGSALTETIDGYLAAAFTKLFDVATPLLVASDVMRGTDLAAPAATALTDITWTDAKAAFLDHSIATVDGNVDAILLDTGTDGVVVATASKTGYALTATGADIILKDSTFALAIADAIWDEILTGAEHNIATSAGRRVREIGAYAIHSGTAQAGNSVHITLAAAASAINGVYNRNLLVLTDGTGADQTRTVIDYNGSTKIATIDREWRVNPDATTEYQIVADDTPLVVDQGIAQEGTATTIKLRAYASSINDTYLCNIVSIVAGTGRGQARLVGAYNGTTKVVTICGENWVTTPDNTSVYIMMPYGTTCVSCVGDDALAQINAQVVDVLKTDTIVEMAQGAPPVNPTIEEAINYLYRKFRNKQETTATEDTIYNDAGDIKLIKSTISDDTVTFTKGEYGSGA